MLIKALTNISGVKDFKLESGDVVELEDEEMREELLKIGAIEVLGELLPAPAPEEQKAPRRRTATKEE